MVMLLSGHEGNKLYSQIMIKWLFSGYLISRQFSISIIMFYDLRSTVFQATNRELCFLKQCAITNEVAMETVVESTIKDNLSRSGYNQPTTCLT